ncbi:MAG: helix-turn-helix domain-containing protein [Armatimonadetes bacterium]|nr:helix-turn-helix domain-containing protein [Armatimonadota bacterium]
MTTQRSVMTLGETADYLRLTAGELYEMAENGIIPSFTVGSQIRFMKATIDQWIESNSQCETSSEIGNAA